MIRKKMAIAAAILIIVATSIIIMAIDKSEKPRIKAPDFPRDVTWLNSGPLTLTELKGKVIVLDFWTYCCINCMHIIPDLKKLEAKYGDKLVVIGVHSAKFHNEQDTENIRQAILRYGIKHPVINDKDFEVWQEYGARAWPTVALIDPEGYLVGMTSGEGIYGSFDSLISDLVEDYKARGLLNEKPLILKPEISTQLNEGPLAFPGKIVADEKSGRLFFSDSGNNRIVISKITGEVVKIIGSGEEGFSDGDFMSAKFFHPQGLCYDAIVDIVYVADTENHAIRKIDLKTEQVTTIAGTGHQSKFYNDGGAGINTKLNSPWDLIKNGDTLYIAMAGSHQIWIFNLETKQVAPYIGSGREDIFDGPRKMAALAQPSGITTDGGYLYWVDSEVSGVRRMGLATSVDSVETIIGTGLFDFGDIDGRYPKAHLQHPIGIAWHDGYIYVADTYNHKIKKIDPEKKESNTFIGIGRRGLVDGTAVGAELNEPNGLCFIGGKMYITDTNNHKIRVFDLASGLVSTLRLSGIEKPAASKNKPYMGSIERLPLLIIAPITKALNVEITLPSGMKINKLAPFLLTIKSSDPKNISIGYYDNRKYSSTIAVPIGHHSGEALLTADLEIGYCGIKNESLCYFSQMRLEIPVEITQDGDKRPSITFNVEK